MFANHPDYAPPKSSVTEQGGGQVPDYIDARGSPQFIELESALHTFRASLFRDFKDYVIPIEDQVTENGLRPSSILDANLYAAYMIPAA